MPFVFMKKAGYLLFVLALLVLPAYGQSWLRAYHHPGEVITRVNTLKSAYGGFALGLEGYYPQTQSFFSRVQCVDFDGAINNNYQDAYIGEPLRLSSGVFETYSSMSMLVPVIDELPLNQFRFRWLHNYPDHSEYWDGMEYILPDSVRSIYEFPTVTNHYSNLLFGGVSYLAAGRVRFSSAYQCFVLDVDSYVSEPAAELTSVNRMVYIPYLGRVSGVARVENNYLAIGQANGWTGKIVLVDSTDATLWQQDFTDGADGAHTPLFTAPLMAERYGYAPHIISYQNKDRILHLARYENQSLQDIYAEQLDGYIAAIPLITADSLITFAYVKGGVQILKQIDLNGTVRWTRNLPGIGNFGRYCLAATGDLSNHADAFCWVTARLDSDGYYLAKVNYTDGSIDMDTITQPQELSISVYPNPCSEMIHVTIEVKDPGNASLELFNLKGQKIATLKDTHYPAGKYTESVTLPSFDSKPLPAGVYLLRLNQAGKHLTRKLLIR